MKNMQELIQQSTVPSAPLGLKAMRQEALEKLKTKGLPDHKQEEWKYTPLKKIVEANVWDNHPQNDHSTLELPNLKGLDAYLLVFVNGRFEASLSQLPEQDEAIQFFWLKDAPENLLQELYSAPPFEDGFRYLNQALAEEGVVIEVKAGKTALKPVVMLNHTRQSSGSVFTQQKNLIVLRNNAALELIEWYSAEGQSLSFSNVHTEVKLEQDAQLHHYKIQAENAEACHVGDTLLHHAAKSVSTHFTFTFQGKMQRNNLNIALKAPFSEAYLYGLYLLDGKTLADNHTLVDHAVPNCYSNELYKGIMDGNATGVFNGKIWVRKDAQKTNAFQSNKNILLSKDATVNTKPQLEIFADDVKCSHGCTTGQLDEESMFYLRSRGISEPKAKQLLMRAFANDILEKVKHEGLKSLLETLLDARLSS